MSSAVKTLSDKLHLKRFFSTLKYSLYVIVHPFDGFWDLTHEKRGSVAAANFIIFMTLVTRLLGLQFTSFLFEDIYWEKVNVFKEIASVLLPVGMGVLANWGLTTLFDGKARMKEIYMAVGYAFTPYVLIELPLVFLSNLVTKTEGAFIQYLDALALIWCGLLIVAAVTQIHDFSLSKTILMLIFTAFGMAVITFIILLFFSLISGGVGYFYSLYREIVFRLY